MTPTEQAARWLADVPKITSFGVPGASIEYDDALAAIARHLAPGDDLVEQIMIQKLPSEMNEDDLDACDYEAGYIGMVKIARKAAARISALTATVAELQAEVDRKIDPQACQDMIEDAVPIMKEMMAVTDEENATLRDRLARMEGALRYILGTAGKFSTVVRIEKIETMARHALTEGGSNG